MGDRDWQCEVTMSAPSIRRLTLSRTRTTEDRAAVMSSADVCWPAAASNSDVRPELHWAIQYGHSKTIIVYIGHSCSYYSYCFLNILGLFWVGHFFKAYYYNQTHFLSCHLENTCLLFGFYLNSIIFYF